MAYAKKAPSGPSYASIAADVKAGKIAPVYYLMGEEAYFIDSLCDLITQAVLPNEEDRDFNLLTFYGPDSNAEAIITAARGLPMMGDRLLVVVKEAQSLRDIDKLEFYLRQPPATTVLVMCHKNGTLDRRKKVAALIDKAGVLFQSARSNDSEILAFIADYSRQKHIELEPRAVQMMAEYIGADLQHMARELDKLAVSLHGEQRAITCDTITDLIGISRQYNIFELQDAIGKRDIGKANEIVCYFDRNEKENPIQLVLASLHKYFSNLLLAYYAPERTERGIAAYLGVQDWQVRRNVMPAMRNYSGTKCLYILNAIRKTDAKSKGVDNPSTPSGELMRELIYFILH